MTSESLHFRTGPRGQVHLAADVWRAVCGVLVDHGEPTDEPVTCRTCTGQREWRGRRSVRPAVLQVTDTAARRRLDLRRADAALHVLEELTRVAYQAWLLTLPSPVSRHFHTPKAPPEAFPPPPHGVAVLVTDLQHRYEGRVHRTALRSTTTAHDELLRLQCYLLPGPVCRREAS